MSFNFMAAVTIYSVFGAKKMKSVTVSIASPSIWHEVMGPDAMILVHSVYQAVGSSTSLELTQICSFLGLSNIPLYICDTTSLSIHQLMDI